jgi:hypothetical protein
MRRHHEAWLLSAGDLPTQAGHAVALTGRLRDAVSALERGRGVLLTEALERGRLDLSQLVRSGHDPLRRRLVDIIGRIDLLGRQELRNRGREEEPRA